MPDTEGAGRTSGANSAYVEYGPIDGCTLEVLYGADGVVNPALGARGGGVAGPCRHICLRADGTVEELPAAADVFLEPGDRIACWTTGGGGYGDPLARPVTSVARDVREGWVSGRRAADVYGVVVDETGVVDEAATAARRA